MPKLYLNPNASYSEAWNILIFPKQEWAFHHTQLYYSRIPAIFIRIIEPNTTIKKTHVLDAKTNLVSNASYSEAWNIMIFPKQGWAFHHISCILVGRDYKHTHIRTKHHNKKDTCPRCQNYILFQMQVTPSHEIFWSF